LRYFVHRMSVIKYYNYNTQFTNYVLHKNNRIQFQKYGMPKDMNNIQIYITSQIVFGCTSHHVSIITCECVCGSDENRGIYDDIADANP